MRTKKSQIERLAPRVKKSIIALRLVRQIPAKWLRYVYVDIWGGGTLYAQINDDMSPKLYTEFRRWLRKEHDFTVLNVEFDRVGWATISLSNCIVEITLNKKLDRPDDYCVQVITDFVTHPVYEWTCPDDPDYAEKIKTSSKLESSQSYDLRL